MMFDDYPLDAHTCQFQVGSCKYLPIAGEKPTYTCLICVVRTNNSFNYFRDKKEPGSFFVTRQK